MAQAPTPLLMFLSCDYAQENAKQTFSLKVSVPQILQFRRTEWQFNLNTNTSVEEGG